MSTRFDLPSGGWVEIKNPDNGEVKAKDKKAVLAALPPSDAAHPHAAGVVGTDALAQAVVLDWGLPYLPDAKSLPVQDVLDELSIADYDALGTFLAPVAKALFPKEATPDDHDVPDSPTAPVGE